MTDSPSAAASTPAAAPTADEKPFSRGITSFSGEPIVNDVVVTVATSNGTGSQSANLILLRTIFQMGIPVGGKNMFPSNIQGLPTWFTIRANGEGWTARRADSDLVVAMNPESVAEDIAGLKPGGILILNQELESHLKREDITAYVVPFAKLVVPVCPEAKLRRLVMNMMYVGVVAWVLDMELDELKRAIARQFSSKPKAAELNTNAVVAAYEWAAEYLVRVPKYTLRRLDKTAGKILIEGNYAAALGLMFGGIMVFAWYPITPSSSLGESLIDLLHTYRHDPETGKATYAVIQAEDEIGALGMVVGAGWGGARAATATSGPGVSLMGEMAGLSYFCEIPAVLIDVQRVGPSTGLPTRTSQGDLLQAYTLSHGDTKHILLIPGNVRECYEFAGASLDLAERLQTIVFLMMDLDLGMNTFMSEELEAPTKPLDRGKVLTAEDLDKIEEFARYRDVDGDGIGYRTLPGTRHLKAPYFTQGAGHDDRAKRSEKPEHWEQNLDRLLKKHDYARTIAPQPVIQNDGDAKVAIIAYGSSDLAVEEARHVLATQHNTPTHYLRLRAVPPSESVREFISRYDKVYLVEQNRDAQVASILRMDFPDVAHRIVPVLHYNGLPLDATFVVENILKLHAAATPAAKA